MKEPYNTYKTKTTTNRGSKNYIGSVDPKYQVKEKITVSSNKNFRSPQFPKRGNAYQNDLIYQNKSVKKNYSERILPPNVKNNS